MSSTTCGPTDLRVMWAYLVALKWAKSMPKRKKTDIVQFKIRLRERLREQLEAAAHAKDISLNSEIVSRLEQSFVQASLQDLIAEGRKDRNRLDERSKEIFRLMAEAWLKLAEGASEPPTDGPTSHKRQLVEPLPELFRELYRKVDREYELGRTESGNRLRRIAWALRQALDQEPELPMQQPRSLPTK